MGWLRLAHDALEDYDADSQSFYAKVLLRDQVGWLLLCFLSGSDDCVDGSGRRSTGWRRGEVED